MNGFSNPTTPDARNTQAPTLDVAKIRNQFPILEQRIYDKPLIYLDSAATSQTPQVVIDTLDRYYKLDNSNVHRGVHTLSVRATKAYEDARSKAQRFINAADPHEIVFVRGTTEGINLVASTFGKTHVKKGDEVLISAMEHHSNIVPWQLLCEEKGARLRVIPMNPNGELLLEEYDKMLTQRTRIVALVHVSNSLGTINPVGRMIEMAHTKGIPVLLDSAQAAPHMPVDVQALDCDFLTFSSHKMYGPTGVGVVYGKHHHLEAMPPYQGGGEMIASVSFKKTTFKSAPHKFEAGTPNIADVVGMGTAIDYVCGIGYPAIGAHEHRILEYATQCLSIIDGLTIIGQAKEKAAIVSFILDGVHPHDVGTILDREGIAVRTGHHCTQPVMDFYGVPATSRVSIGVYNTVEEIDALIAALRTVKEVFN